MRPVVLPDLAVPLAPLTTLRLGGPARRLIEAESADEVVTAVRDADEPVLVMGGGSNLVIADAGWPGVVVRIASRGRRVERRKDGSVLLTVEAGEDWDDVVAATVADGLGGLECLSGIPGRTGAVPVQNVGAYGVEIADALVDVDLWTGAAVRRVAAADLGLAYRTSVLKGRSDAIVLRARIALPGDDRSAPIRYAELAGTLGVAVGDRVPAAVAREAVLDLRRRQGHGARPRRPRHLERGLVLHEPRADGGPTGRPDLARRAGAGEGFGGLADRALGVPQGPSRAGWPGGVVEPSRAGAHPPWRWHDRRSVGVGGGGARRGSGPVRRVVDAGAGVGRMRFVTG